MAGTLAVVGGVLLVGWVIWWWLLRGHQRGVADLLRRAEEMDKQHES